MHLASAYTHLGFPDLADKITSTLAVYVSFRLILPSESMSEQSESPSSNSLLIESEDTESQVSALEEVPSAVDAGLGTASFDEVLSLNIIELI